jgi:hypothetical protein
MLVMLWQHPDIPPIVLLLSAVYPVYYTGLSLALHWRRYTRNYAGT